MVVMASGTPLNAAQADLDAVEAIVRAAGTSFYRGMRVLPPDRRHAMYAIYAFCRMVDDIADEAGAFADKLPELTAWRERVAALYRGQSDGPVTRILAVAVARFDLHQTDFLAVIDGMQMDATSIATVSLPPSAASRCGRSVMHRTPPTRSHIRLAAHSNSPTSCATSGRMPNAAGSTCRANGWTSPRCRTIRSPHCRHLASNWCARGSLRWRMSTFTPHRRRCGNAMPER
jgi:hypothetical protein